MAQNARVHQTEQAQLQLERRWAVYLLNDDYTAFEWVQTILMSLFHLTMDQAYEVTMSVHLQGEGLAGIYEDREQADTLAKKAMALSRTRGYPLMCQVRPVEAEA